MLSIGKLAPGQHNYYLDTVAAGTEEYYTGAREAPGRWVGSASELLGLNGKVTAHELAAVLRAVGTDGHRLTANQGPPRVPGFDCTFCAPKSVSLLFALGSPEITRNVRAAHDAAVDAALGVLEHEAARARRGRGGLTQVDAEGFVGAAFRHRTSRAGDPHLHTHVLVANLAYVATEDRWSALDARPIYAWAKTAGYLYEAHLRAELTERLGVDWHEPTRGIADIVGIPTSVLRHFSQRRQQIDAHLKATGASGSRAAQAAAYATRKAKDTTTSFFNLFEQWHTRAASVGFDVEKLPELCGRTGRHEPILPDSDEAEVIFVRLASPAGVTENRSAFNRRDVIQAICDLVPAGARADEVLALADAFLDSPRHVVALSEGRGDRIRRADGASAPVSTDERCFTTPDMLRTETLLLRMAGHRRAVGVAVVDDKSLATAIDARPSLTDEQRRMVRRICRSGDGVDIVEGVAGAGKTFALAAAADGWATSGHQVVGAALAARTARQLENGTGIPSSTLDRLLLDLDRPVGRRLTSEHVVVIDEAAMVGTRKLARLIEHAHRANAKVVLVGDPCQLPEIEAGGAFAALARRTDRTTLSTNRRQHEPWERQALSDLRHGHIHEALAAYNEHGRIHIPASGDAGKQLIDDWWAAREQGEHVLMLAGHHRDVAELNDRARQRRQSAGELGADEVVLGDRAFSVGDEVLALKNDYPLGLLNGTRGTITRLDRDRVKIAVRADDGKNLELPFSYAEDGLLAHGYAMTIHKAQGATCDRALVLVDETMPREAIYTAVSRGRQRNDLYLAVDTGRDEIAHALEADRDAVGMLVSGMERSAAQQMAIDSRG